MARFRLNFLFVFFSFIVLISSTVFADSAKRQVKVAFVPIEGMQIIDKNGNPKGYMYEYFNQLAIRGNWDIQYIPMTWTEALSALKSGKIDFARLYNTPSSNIVIRNCLMESGHGGVTLGSENSGGINNVIVEKCLFKISL